MLIDSVQTQAVIAIDILDQCNAMKLNKEDYKLEFRKRAVDRLEISDEEADSLLATLIEVAT